MARRDARATASFSVLAAPAPRSSCLQLKERRAGGGCAGLLLNESGACGSSWKPGRPVGNTRGSAPMGLGRKRSCRSWNCASRQRGSVCAVHCCGAGSCGLDWGMVPSSGHCAYCRYHRRKAEGPHSRAVHDSLFYIQTRLCTLQLNSIECVPRVLSRHLRVRARALGPRGRVEGTGEHQAAGGHAPTAPRRPVPAASRTFTASPSPCRPQLSQAPAAAPPGAGQLVALRTRQVQANPPEGPRGQGARCLGCWGPPASAPAARRSTPTGRTRPR